MKDFKMKTVKLV